MNGYLVVAYGFVWGIFTLYVWVIHSRRQKLEKEVEQLKKAFGAK
jgi:CcmD family protein